MARTLDSGFNPSAGLRRHFGASLQRRLLAARSPATIFGGVLEVQDLLEPLPTRLNRFLDRVAAAGAVGLIASILFGDE